MLYGTARRRLEKKIEKTREQASIIDAKLQERKYETVTKVKICC